MTTPEVSAEVLGVAPDGTLTVKVTVTPGTAPPPGPEPAPVPTAVRIGLEAHVLHAVNPTATSNPPGAPYPGARGPNQLVGYRYPVVRLVTNSYGHEVSIGADHLVHAAATNLDEIPAAGWVLSGHGTAAAWLREHASVGATVAFTDASPPPPPPVTDGPTIAVYSMSGSMIALPAEATQMRVAFLQGTDLVEWRADTREAIHTRVKAWKAGDPARRQVILSLGGSGGSVDMSRLVASVRAVETKMPLDGIDFDIEGGALDVNAAVAAAKALAAGRESTWLTTFTPPGGPPVALYLNAAKRCQEAGLRVQLSQQLYDTKITQDDVIRQTSLAIGVLGAENVLLGCMVGDDPAKYSTVTQWETYLRDITARWPAFGGAVLWESSRVGTADWARRMAGVLT